MQNPILRISAAFSSACAVFLFACAAPNPYRPFSDGVGYTELSIAQGKYEVMYHGTADQDELTAKHYAIVRAAEIAKRDSSAWFRVDNGKTKEQEDRATVSETDTRVYNNRYNDPYWGKHARKRTVTRTVRSPVVKIQVTIEPKGCGQCLSTDATLADAANAGILGPN